MSLSFIFPGQASQFVGMGKDFFDKYSLAQEMYHTANEIVDYDLQKFSFEGPEEELKQTYVTQPAIFVHSCIVSNHFWVALQCYRTDRSSQTGGLGI